MTARARHFQRLQDARIGPNYAVRVGFKQRLIEDLPTPWNTALLRDELAVFAVRVNVVARNVPHARELAIERVLAGAPSGRERRVDSAQVVADTRSMCQLTPETRVKIIKDVRYIANAHSKCTLKTP